MCVAVLNEGKVQIQPLNDSKRYLVTGKTYYVVPGDTVFVDDKPVSATKVPTICIVIDKPKVTMVEMELFARNRVKLHLHVCVDL